MTRGVCNPPALPLLSPPIQLLLPKILKISLSGQDPA